MSLATRPGHSTVPAPQPAAAPRGRPDSGVLLERLLRRAPPAFLLLWRTRRAASRATQCPLSMDALAWSQACMASYARQRDPARASPAQRAACPSAAALKTMVPILHHGARTFLEALVPAIQSGWLTSTRLLQARSLPAPGRRGTWDPAELAWAPAHALRAAQLLGGLEHGLALRDLLYLSVLLPAPQHMSPPLQLAALVRDLIIVADRRGTVTTPDLRGVERALRRQRAGRPLPPHASLRLLQLAELAWPRDMARYNAMFYFGPSLEHISLAEGQEYFQFFGSMLENAVRLPLWHLLDPRGLVQLLGLVPPPVLAGWGRVVQELIAAAARGDYQRARQLPLHALPTQTRLAAAPAQPGQAGSGPHLRPAAARPPGPWAGLSRQTLWQACLDWLAPLGLDLPSRPPLLLALSPPAEAPPATSQPGAEDVGVTTARDSASSQAGSGMGGQAPRKRTPKASPPAAVADVQRCGVRASPRAWQLTWLPHPHRSASSVSSVSSASSTRPARPAHPAARFGATGFGRRLAPTALAACPAQGLLAPWTAAGPHQARRHAGPVLAVGDADGAITLFGNLYASHADHVQQKQYLGRRQAPPVLLSPPGDPAGQGPSCRQALALACTRLVPALRFLLMNRRAPRHRQRLVRFQGTPQPGDAVTQLLWWSGSRTGGRHLLSCHAGTGALRLWDLGQLGCPGRHPLTSVRAPEALDRLTECLQAVASPKPYPGAPGPDGPLVAAGYRSGTVLIWDLRAASEGPAHTLDLVGVPGAPAVRCHRGLHLVLPHLCDVQWLHVPGLRTAQGRQPQGVLLPKLRNSAKPYATPNLSWLFAHAHAPARPSPGHRPLAARDLAVVAFHRTRPCFLATGLPSPVTLPAPWLTPAGVCAAVNRAIPLCRPSKAPASHANLSALEFLDSGRHLAVASEPSPVVACYDLRALRHASTNTPACAPAAWPCGAELKPGHPQGSAALPRQPAAHTSSARLRSALDLWLAGGPGALPAMVFPAGGRARLVQRSAAPAWLRAQALPAGVTSLALSACGTRLLVGTADTRAFLHTLGHLEASGATQAYANPDPAVGGSHHQSFVPSLSPDSTVLAATLGSHRLAFWQVCCALPQAAAAKAATPHTILAALPGRSLLPYPLLAVCSATLLLPNLVPA